MCFATVLKKFTHLGYKYIFIFNIYQRPTFIIIIYKCNVRVLPLLEVMKLIYSIHTVDDFCKAIDVKINFLKYILYVKKDTYYQFEIKKKSGGVRIITAPCEELKFIQRKLLVFLERNYNFLSCQHGFIKGKSCVSNAKMHVGKRFVLNCDIENFFDNIHFGRVQGLFMKAPFNYSNEVATIISKIVCYKRKLPQGAPTSPIISNMICYTIDKQLEKLAKSNNCRYTRYADDITFSTDSEKFPSKIAKLVNGKAEISDYVINVLNGGYDNGFKINTKKTILYRRYVKQEVTGIVVNRKTNVDNRYVKRLRAIIYKAKTNGFIKSCIDTFNIEYSDETLAKEKLFNYLAGKISYLKMVKSETDNIYLKYANEFNSLFDCEIFDITDEIRIRKYAQSRCYVIECGGNGTGFALNNNEIITSTHVILNDITCPNFVCNKKNSKYNNQFPINSEDVDFVKLLHPKLSRSKLITDFKLSRIDYESDICKLNISINNKNKMNLSKRKVKQGDIVYMIGYPAFKDFKTTTLKVIKTKVIGENELFDRKLFNTSDAPPHGMSGGPVLNSSREVVGIVYAGNDDLNNTDNVGFIDLVEKNNLLTS